MLRKTNLINAIHDGVFKAHEQFERLSGGIWMSDPDAGKSEGFLVSHIVRSIGLSMQPEETPILELPFGYIKEWTNAGGIGRPLKGIKPGRRVDVTILNKEGRPIHLVEVKLRWTQEARKDVDKLTSLLASFGPKKGGSLKSVFLSVYWQRTNHPSLEKKMKDLERKLRKELDSEGMNLHFNRRHQPKTRKDGKKWEFGSHIIELARKNK